MVLSYYPFITCIFLQIYFIKLIYFFIIGLGSRKINDMDMNFRCGKTCVNCLTLIGLTQIKTSKKTLM